MDLNYKTRDDDYVIDIFNNNSVFIVNSNNKQLLNIIQNMLIDIEHGDITQLVTAVQDKNIFIPLLDSVLSKCIKDYQADSIKEEASKQIKTIDIISTEVINGVFNVKLEIIPQEYDINKENMHLVLPLL